MPGVGNLTVYVRLNADFPTYGIQLTNVNSTKPVPVRTHESQFAHITYASQASISVLCIQHAHHHNALAFITMKTTANGGVHAFSISNSVSMPFSECEKLCGGGLR